MCSLPANVAPWCAEDHESASKCAARVLITISNLVLKGWCRQRILPSWSRWLSLSRDGSLGARATLTLLAHCCVESHIPGFQYQLVLVKRCVGCRIVSGRLVLWSREP